MDLSQNDDVALEIATVLDEVSAVHCRLVKKAKVKRKPAPCSYFLQSAKDNKTLQKFWEKKVVAIDDEYVERISGIGITTSKEVDSHIPEESVEEPESSSYTSSGIELHTYDIEQAERFAGIFPEPFKQIDFKRGGTPEEVFVDYWKSADITPEGSPLTSRQLFPDYEKSVGVTDERTPPISFELLPDYWKAIDVTTEHIDYEQLKTPSPPVDVPTILKTAKKYFTEEDVVKLHSISKTLDALEDKYTSEEDDKDVTDMADVIINDLLEEHTVVISEKHSPNIGDISDTETLLSSSVGSDEERKNLVPITEVSDVEPEDSAGGWLVSPVVYKDASPAEIGDDLEAINEIATVFVENVISEAEIVVKSWSRALLQMEKNRQAAAYLSASDTTSKELLCSTEIEQKEPHTEEENIPVVATEESSELSLPQSSTALPSLDEKKSDFPAQHTSADGLLDASASVKTKVSKGSSSGKMFSRLCCCMASKTDD